MSRSTARTGTITRAIGIGALCALLAAGCSQTANAPESRPAASTGTTAPGTAAPAPAADNGAKPPPVELTNTAVYEITSDATRRTYPIWVDVPASYAQSDKAYPVVFVTDALYSFPLVRSIRNLLGQKGRNIEDFILVGLPPQAGLTSLESRSRDYTPSNPLTRPGKVSHRYTAKLYGEAAAYRDFIDRQVFPLVASRYRADMNRKTFAGHSLGALFGSFVLFTKPGMFQNYILGSPSLWFDQHEILKFEQAYANDHRDLPARVMMYIGMYETINPQPRYYKTNDMIGDMRAFERTLKARRYPSLSIGSQVIADEDHFTVFPSLISRGLLWALPGHGPYSSG